jgi:hypothetical protein
VITGKQAFDKHVVIYTENILYSFQCTVIRATGALESFRQFRQGIKESGFFERGALDRSEFTKLIPYRSGDKRTQSHGASNLHPPPHTHTQSKYTQLNCPVNKDAAYDIKT